MHVRIIRRVPPGVRARVVSLRVLLLLLLGDCRERRVIVLKVQGAVFGAEIAGRDPGRAAGVSRVRRRRRRRGVVRVRWWGRRGGGGRRRRRRRSVGGGVRGLGQRHAASAAKPRTLRLPLAALRAVLHLGRCGGGGGGGDGGGAFFRLRLLPARPPLVLLRRRRARLFLGSEGSICLFSRRARPPRLRLRALRRGEEHPLNLRERLRGSGGVAPVHLDAAAGPSLPRLLRLRRVSRLAAAPRSLRLRRGPRDGPVPPRRSPRPAALRVRAAVVALRQRRRARPAVDARPGRGPVPAVDARPRRAALASAGGGGVPAGPRRHRRRRHHRRGGRARGLLGGVERGGPGLDHRSGRVRAGGGARRRRRRRRLGFALGAAPSGGGGGGWRAGGKRGNERRLGDGVGGSLRRRVRRVWTLRRLAQPRLIRRGLLRPGLAVGRRHDAVGHHAQQPASRDRTPPSRVDLARPSPRRLLLRRRLGNRPRGHLHFQPALGGG
mmetsp:Transcript_2398/g.10271  ORF Transcript_2398/g.10271 Transcript_2398/m.10271 type:complete len:494 (+) Transcript_2398:1505-2986(+)